MKKSLLKCASIQKVIFKLEGQMIMIILSIKWLKPIPMKYVG